MFARQGFLPSVLTMMTIAAVASNEKIPLANALSFRPLRFIGICGYGIFLFHQNIFTLFSSITSPYLEAFIGLSITLLLGSMSYLFIEYPAMKWHLSDSTRLTLSKYRRMIWQQDQ